MRLRVQAVKRRARLELAPGTGCRTLGHVSSVTRASIGPLSPACQATPPLDRPPRSPVATRTRDLPLPGCWWSQTRVHSAHGHAVAHGVRAGRGKLAEGRAAL